MSFGVIMEDETDEKRRLSEDVSRRKEDIIGSKKIQKEISYIS